jgi:hypothetical protein
MKIFELVLLAGKHVTVSCQWEKITGSRQLETWNWILPTGKCGNWIQPAGKHGTGSCQQEKVGGTGSWQRERVELDPTSGKVYWISSAGNMELDPTCRERWKLDHGTGPASGNTWNCILLTEKCGNWIGSNQR